MNRLLPPLNSIKTFEVAARCLSFSNAAHEMGVTQGAVSKQIKLLEDFLGVSLFKRFPHSLELTWQGKEYYDAITHSFDAIENITHKISSQEKRNRLLKVNVSPSFANYWLIPRIKSFSKEHPDISLKLENGDGMSVNFSKIDADIAIRGGYKPLPGVENHHLMDEEMVCVCSQDLIDKVVGGIKSFNDIKKLPLLEHSLRPYIWKEWMMSVGIAQVKVDKSLSFEHFSKLLNAARDGAGVAFLPNFVVERDLKDKKLVNLLDIKYKTNFNYYLLYPMYNTNSHKVGLFKEWIDSVL